MNYLSIVNAARQEGGVSASDLTTVVGQRGEAKRFVDWCNRAWLDLQAMRQDWLWMRSTAAFQTIAGQATYTPAQAGVTNFGLWTRDTFRNYSNPVVSLTIASPCVVSLQANRLLAGDTVTFSTDGALPTGLTAGTAYYVVSPTADAFEVSASSGGSPINTTGSQSGTITITSNNTASFVGLKTEIFMGYVDWEDYRNAYLYGALRSIETRAFDISITPNKSIALGPIPISGYTVLGDYYMAPTDMIFDTDIPSLPAKFHMAIVYKALLSYGMYESASEVVLRGTAESEKWMRRILADQVGEIVVGGALA